MLWYGGDVKKVKYVEYKFKRHAAVRTQRNNYENTAKRVRPGNELLDGLGLFAQQVKSGISG